jgi:hypothetical protein
MLCDQAEVTGPRQAHAQFAEKSRTVTLANCDTGQLRHIRDVIDGVLAGYSVNEIGLPKNSW